MNHFKLEPESNIFYTLHLEISHRCNMQCENCYLPNRTKPDLNRKDIYNFLKKLPKRTDIRLIGGEPTLHQELPEIIGDIKRLGHRPILITNGVRLSCPNYVNSLWEQGLRRLSISMNGVNSTEAYKKMDKCSADFALRKQQALENVIHKGMIVNSQTIIAKGINDHLILDMIRMVEATSKKYNRTLSLQSYPLICRFKTIGQIGRYASGYSMNLDGLIDLFTSTLQIDYDFINSHNVINGFKENHSRLFPFKTTNGTLLIKLTNWSTDNHGVPDPNSKRRGRITEDWKIAPCFEDIKLNEFQF